MNQCTILENRDYVLSLYYIPISNEQCVSFANDDRLFDIARSPINAINAATTRSHCMVDAANPIDLQVYVPVQLSLLFILPRECKLNNVAKSKYMLIVSSDPKCQLKCL